MNIRIAQPPVCSVRRVSTSKMYRHRNFQRVIPEESLARGEIVASLFTDELDEWWPVRAQI